MANDLLLTHHHRQAMVNACDRGFWMPLPLSDQQAHDISFLTAVSRGSTAITAVAEITSLERWREPDGRCLWLPFLSQLVPLLRPVPLGDPQLLSGWLPQQRDQLQLLRLDDLLRAEQLSDLLHGSGAHCCRPPAPGAVAGHGDQAA